MQFVNVTILQSPQRSRVGGRQWAIMAIDVDAIIIHHVMPPLLMAPNRLPGRQPVLCWTAK